MQYFSMKREYRIFFPFLTVAAVCACLNTFGILDADIRLETVAVIGISSVFCACFIRTAAAGISERAVLAFGYLVRLAYLYLDSAKDFLLFGGGYDAGTFWKIALGRYQGLETRRITTYPYVLEAFMHIFGENRVLLQYVNILFWLFTAFIVIKCLTMLQVTGRARLLCVAVLSFFPQYIVLSSILMRESMIIFLNAASLYYFIKWYQGQKFRHIVKAELLVLLSMILHSGAVALGAAYGIAYAIYYKRNKKVKFSKKTVVAALFGFLVIYVIFFSPYRSAATAYLPKVENIFSIQLRPFDERGGSNYLRDMPYTENILILLRNTLIRMLYFFASPVPWEWRGMTDALAFGMDACFHGLVIALGLYRWKKSRKKRKIVGFLVLCILLTGVVFAWGVSNAGTAMRQRCKLVGVEVVLLGVCLCKNADAKDHDEAVKNRSVERNLF